MNRFRAIAVICLVAGAGVAVAQTVSGFRQADKEKVSIGAILDVAPAAVPMGKGKICSVFVPNQWRDSLSVADGWTLASCRDYMAKMGGVWYQLGCMQPAGAVFGEVNGGGPVPSCGW